MRGTPLSNDPTRCAATAISPVSPRLDRLSTPGRAQPGPASVDAEMLAEVGPSPAELPRVYVCGPTPFVEAVAEALVQLGHEPRGVKTERFGPTGG